MGPQERALKAGVDIVVATPGRLMDHMRSTTGRLRQARHAGARRGGPDDGHGLLARRPPHRRRRCRIGRAADAALLGDDAGRSDEAGGRGRARRASTCRSDRPAARRTSITHTIENVPAAREDRVAGEVPAAHAAVRCSCSCARSRAPSGWRASWRRSASRPRRCTPIGRSSSGRRRSKASAAAATACWWRPTSPRAASTSTASRTS